MWGLISGEVEALIELLVMGTVVLMGLHLGLVIDMIWVILMAYLMVLVLENLSENINMIYFNEMKELDLICMRLADMLMLWI